MRIVVADDHSLFRDGIVSLLEAAGHEIVGQAGSGEEAVRLAAEVVPEVILMDLNMPKMDGIQALSEIRSKHPEMKVILLTVSEEEQDLVKAAQAGASGYLLKNLEGEEFLRLLQGVMEGGTAMTDKTASRLWQALSSPKRAVEDPAEGLTNREMDLLELVALGKSNRQIGDSLTISENTVKFHMKNIMQKLGASNRTEVVSIAIRQGLLNPSSNS